MVEIGSANQDSFDRCLAQLIMARKAFDMGDPDGTGGHATICGYADR